MPTKSKAKKRTVAKKPARGKKPKAMSREARIAHSEVQQGVRHLEKAMEEIRKALVQAERKIEAESRLRIRELRQDARAQLALLKTKERAASALLKRVSAAASGSWQDIRRSVDSVLTDARGTATAVVGRFRRALNG